MNSTAPESPESMAQAASQTPPENPPQAAADDDRPGDPPSPREQGEAYKSLLRKALALAAQQAVDALTPHQLAPSEPGKPEPGMIVELSRAMQAAELAEKLQAILQVEHWTRKLEKVILEKPDTLSKGPALPPSLAKLSGMAQRTKKAAGGDHREGRNKGPHALPQDD